jgi:hypothetical protein
LERNFGLVIAFLLPGFVCLAGAARFSPTIAGWMSLAPTSDPTVVGFLYVLLASIGAGLVASAVRWAIIDTVHHRTGLPPPNLDFSRLQANLDAFQIAVEHNYRHYQFYANTLIASGFFSVCDQLVNGRWPLWLLTVTAILEGVLFVTSRDCLRRYYRRTEQLLGRGEERRIIVSDEM